MSVFLPFPHTDIFTEQLTTDRIIEHLQHPNFSIDNANILDMLHSVNPVNFFPKGEVLEVDVQRFLSV
jgi:hypothetical protein